MNELKKEVINALKDISNAFTEEARKSYKEERYVDLTECNSKFADTMSNIMIKFDEAEVRMNRKKRFFK